MSKLVEAKRHVAWFIPGKESLISNQTSGHLNVSCRTHLKRRGRSPFYIFDDPYPSAPGFGVFKAPEQAFRSTGKGDFRHNANWSTCEKAEIYLSTLVSCLVHTLYPSYNYANFCDRLLALRLVTPEAPGLFYLLSGLAKQPREIVVLSLK